MPSLLPAVTVAVFALVAVGIQPAIGAEPSAERVREILVEALSDDPGALRSLLPSKSKVFLALETPRAVHGYFGANQVVTVFRKVVDSHADPEVDELPAADDRRMATVAARLTSRDRGGGALVLRFVLRQGKNGWTVREVREGA